MYADDDLVALIFEQGSDCPGAGGLVRDLEHVPDVHGSFYRTEALPWVAGVYDSIASASGCCA